MRILPSPSNKPAAYAFSSSVNILTSINRPQQPICNLLFSGTGLVMEVRRRVQVRMGRVAARDTEEMRLGCSIGFLALPATATGLAGVGRVDVDHPHACLGR